MTLSVGEIVVIVLVLAIVFSASRMGALGNAIGKFVYSFKKASKGSDLVDGGKLTRVDRTGQAGPIEDAEVVDSPKKKS